MGGMATVYLARDLKHGRDVAVKVLRPDLAATVGSERFLREIEIAARLTHPNILGLHDSGEAEGFLYYVMPYVSGGSLRGRLQQTGILSVEAAMGIIREVAEALNYAHREGVIHRDIKPENILSSEGHAIVADFGIAKAIITAGGENLTKSGFPLGTPGYMSPEQAAGLTSLDELTDVYGIGCVFYEMVVAELQAEYPTEDGRLTIGVLEEVMVEVGVLPERLREAAEEIGGDIISEGGYATGEIKEIIERAVELEARYSEDSWALSLGGVEQVGAEAGIAPKFVRDAAGELARPEDVGVAVAQKGSGFFGRSPVLRVDRFVDREISGPETANLVEEIRSKLDLVGHVSAAGTSLTWVASAPGEAERNIRVTISAGAGRTSIHIEENITDFSRQLAGGFVGLMSGGLFGIGFGVVTGDPGLGSLFVVIFAAAGAYVFPRSDFVNIANRHEIELEELGDSLAELAAGTGGLSEPPLLQA